MRAGSWVREVTFPGVEDRLTSAWTGDGEDDLARAPRHGPGEERTTLPLCGDEGVHGGGGVLTPPESHLEPGRVAADGNRAPVHEPAPLLPPGGKVVRCEGAGHVNGWRCSKFALHGGTVTS